VTAMLCVSSSSLKEKEKEKEIQNKIDKRKRKMLVSKVFHNKPHVHLIPYSRLPCCIHVP